MISLNFRHSDPVDIPKVIKGYCDSQYNPNTFPEIEGPIKMLHQGRCEIINAHNVKTNQSQVEALIKKTIEYLGLLSVVSQSFVFGKESGQVNICFTWYDSITKEKKASPAILLERLSVLYNLGVMYSVVATQMCGSGKDVWKEASKLFQRAAWLFEKIKSETSNLKSTEISNDFHEYNLNYLQNLMLCQAQICVYEKGKAANISQGNLSALSNQVSIFYGKCLGAVSSTPLEKEKHFAQFMAMLHYGEFLYDAYSSFHEAENRKSEVEKTAKGMGLCIAYARKMEERLNQIKASFSKNLPEALKDQLNNQITKYSQIRQKYEKENSTIYFEAVPPEKDIPKKDSKCLVKPENFENELKIDFKSNPGLVKITELIPVPVRQLKAEYDNYLNSILSKATETSKKLDLEDDNLLKTYGLPACIQDISNESQFPDDLWEKIKDINMKGGTSSVDNSLKGLQQVASNNNGMLLQIENMLNEEENGDKMMVQQYGPKWSRVPSNALNMNQRKQVEYLKNKISLAQNADKKTEGKFLSNSEGYKLLTLAKQDLTEKMPKSHSNSKEEHPIVTKIRNSLSELNKFKRKREEIVDKILKSISSDNVTSDLMLVYQGQKQKQKVFEENSAKYEVMISEINSMNESRQEQFQILMNSMKEFEQLKQTMARNPERVEFFKKINDAIESFYEIGNNASQGMHFYTQFSTHIQRLSQETSDFIMSRNLQKTELIASLCNAGSNSFGSQISGNNPYGSAMQSPTQPGQMNQFNNNYSNPGQYGNNPPNMYSNFGNFPPNMQGNFPQNMQGNFPPNTNMQGNFPPNSNMQGNFPQNMQGNPNQNNYYGGGQS